MVCVNHLNRTRRTQLCAADISPRSNCGNLPLRFDDPKCADREQRLHEADPLTIRERARDPGRARA